MSVVSLSLHPNGDMTENEGLNMDHHSFPWHSTFFLRINFKGCITFHCLDNYTLANQSPNPIVWHLGFSKFGGLHKYVCAFMIISSGYKQRSGSVGCKYMNIPKVFPTVIKIPSQSCPNFYLQLQAHEIQILSTLELNQKLITKISGKRTQIFRN